MAKRTKKEKAEQAIINQLQADHGYMFYKVGRRAERETSTCTIKGGAIVSRGHAVGVLLYAPASSFLGKHFLSAYTASERKPKRGAK